MKRVAAVVGLLALLSVAACARRARTDCAARRVVPPVAAPKSEPSAVPPWAKVAPEQIAEAKKHGVPVAFENDLGMRFVLIPAGTFLMGWRESEASPPGTKRHAVTLTRPFYIMVTEVTNRQFRAMRGGHASPPGRNDDNQPVVNIYWRDAMAFSAWLSAREAARRYELPTEAQWEMACRAGTTTTFSFGHTLTGHEANIDDSTGYIDTEPDPAKHYAGSGISRRHTLAVGSLGRNAWGLYDMHGNAWEYCQDWYGPYPKSQATDPQGVASGTLRVIRGGAVGFRHWLAASPCRTAYRLEDRSDDAGFRLVSPLPERGK